MKHVHDDAGENEDGRRGDRDKGDLLGPRLRDRRAWATILIVAAQV